MVVQRLLTLTPAIVALLDELADLRCGCSPKDAMSGHRVDCRMPWVREAEENLRRVLEHG